MKIGVTERGDGGIDLSWVQKLDKVDGAIIITKNLTDKCIKVIMENQEKIIVHCTCTGFGGTILEPNVPEYKKQIKQLKKLIDKGFPAIKVVLRVDPLIPTEKGLETAQSVIDYALSEIEGIQRIRISIIDMYPHVRKRFEDSKLPLPYGNNFAPSAEQVMRVNNWVKDNREKYSNVEFEACAEGKLHFCIQRGCVSKYDAILLGIEVEDGEIRGISRVGCLCLSCKTELLSTKHPCEHNCLYCYWKRDGE